jgi:hypothetical protein
VIKTARHLGLDYWEAIDHSDEAELPDFLQNCREWEGDTEPDGRQLPRAKHTTTRPSPLCV